MYAIRRAVPEDAAALSAIAKAAKANLGYPVEWLAAWDAALTIDAAYLARHPVWLGVTSGAMTPAGFVALVDEGDCWRLDHLWVAPEHQGHGLGRQLWNTALASARERRPGSVRIEAEPRSADFYEHCGARLVGHVPAPVLGEPRVLPVFEITVAGG